MPFTTLEAAREGNFPTKINNVDLSLGQVNHLARIFDAIRDVGNADNPMDAAISQFRRVYKVEGSGDERRWVRRIKGKNIHLDDHRMIIIRPVLVPEEPDEDNETVTLETIEKGFYKQAVRKARMLPSETGIEHEGDTVEGILTVQDYLLLEDTEIEGETIPKGTWMRGWKFDTQINPDLAELFKEASEGDLQGASIQGRWEANA